MAPPLRLVAAMLLAAAGPAWAGKSGGDSGTALSDGAQKADSLPKLQIKKGGPLALPVPPPEPTVAEVLADNGVRVEGKPLDCPLGGLAEPVYAAFKRRSMAVRAYRYLLAAAVWGISARSEDAGTLFFFEGKGTPARDAARGDFTSYWRAKAAKREDLQETSAVSAMLRLAEEPRITELAYDWRTRLRYFSADLRPLAKEEEEAEARAAAAVKKTYGFEVNAALLHPPLIALKTQASRDRARAVHDCDHWSVFVDADSPKRCEQSRALFANLAADMGHKEWAATSGHPGGWFLILDPADTPPKKHVAGRLVHTYRDLTPETASACEGDLDRSPIAAAPRSDAGGPDEIREMLPAGEAREAWDAMVADCRGVGYIPADWEGGAAPNFDFANDKCWDRFSASRQASGELELSDAQLARACGRVRSLVEARGLEWIFRDRLTKLYDCWLKKQSVPAPVRCRALYEVAFDRWISLPTEVNFTLADVAAELNRTYGLRDCGLPATP